MHTDILSEKDRKALCDFLFEKASDEDLLELAHQTKSRQLRIQSDLSDIKKFVGSTGFSKPVTSVEPTSTPVKAEKAKAEPVADESKTNITPPGTASKRIGSSNKDTIMRLLKDKPRTASQINAGINGVQNNTDALLKLLWDRKELKFDGREFYV